eukprot:1706068-Pyramimonas_sp.AAC.1
MDLKAYVDTTRDELLAFINSIQTSIGSLANTGAEGHQRQGRPPGRKSQALGRTARPHADRTP